MKSQSFVVTAIAALSIAFAGGVASAAEAGGTDSTVIAQDGLPIPPGGTQVAPNQWSYDGGRVTITVPTTGIAGRGAFAPLAGLPCTDGYVCLYFDANWLGRRLQFQDPSWQNLRTWGASDEISSWSNHENRVATLSWDIDGGGAHYHMDPGAHAASMGSWNDEASAVHG